MKGVFLGVPHEYFVSQAREFARMARWATDPRTRASYRSSVRYCAHAARAAKKKTLRHLKELEAWEAEWRARNNDGAA